MEDADKTKEQLIDELIELRRQIAGLEKATPVKDTTYKQLWSTYSQSPIPTLIVSKEGRIVEYNDAMVGLTGYTHEEVPSVDEWMHKVYPDEEYRNRVIEIGRESRYREIDVKRDEYTITGKDGEQRCIQFSVCNILRDGIPTDLQVIQGEDITERKKVETELSGVYDALNSSINGVIIANLEGEITYVNPAFLRMFEYKDTSDIVGKTANDLFVTGEVYKFAEVTAIIDDAKGETEDFSVRRKDGTIFPVEVASSIVTDNMGSARMAAFVDITERKQAEEALIEEHNLLRTLIDNLPDFIYVKDTESRFVISNIAVERLMGPKTQGKLLGKTDFDFYPQELAAQYYTDEQEIIRSGLPLVDREEPLLDQVTGREGWLSTTKVPLRDSQGRIIGIVGIGRNITARKQMEEEFLKIEKHRSVGVLAGGIAHDFNNILTGILGNIFLAGLYTDSDKISERLVEAERASIRAKDLIQQLLTFSKSGAPIKKIVSIADLLKNSVIFALRGSNVRCETAIPDDLWPAEIDEGQMNQVISNLVINADQAMASGGIVKVRAENMTIEAESGLPLKEGDHGIGIPEDDLPKIFDPYFTTKQKGSGLGLATTYSVVKNHDGHITVESHVGVGTTFHMYLPAFPVEEEKVAGKPITGEGRILVMDDEELLRELVSDMLTNIGYEVTAAIDGAEAIELYKEATESGNPFDAVIIDLTIPGAMGGKKTIQKLREIDPGVKAIVSSGYSNDPIMADFRMHGFKGVIAKPYETKELSEVLHRVIMSTGD